MSLEQEPQTKSNNDGFDKRHYLPSFSKIGGTSKKPRASDEARNPYRCQECPETRVFFHKLKLKRHLKIVHNIGSYPYTCKKCGNGYFNKVSFMKHSSNHEGKKCDICGQIFDNWTLLTNHRRTEHKRKKVETKLECDLCGKFFCRKPNIREHMKIHIMTDLVYQCTYENCSKFYSHKRNLFAHVRSKHEGRRFVCPLCNVKLSTNQKLKLHIEAHSDSERVKNIKKPKVALVLGIKVYNENTSSSLLHENSITRNDGISTESEFSDNNM